MLDTGIVGELLVVAGVGAMERLCDLIGTYRRESAALTDCLADAVERDDGDLLERTAHALKGNSAILGAVRLPELCDRFQSAGADKPAARALVAEIRRAVEQFQAALDAMAADVRRSDRRTGGAQTGE